MTHSELSSRASLEISTPQHCEPTLRLLAPADIDLIIALERITIKALDNKALYHPGAREFFEESLSGNGVVIGCFAEERLIGFRSIWFPKSSPENLGHDIGITNQLHLNAVAHLERSCVHPKYRGNRLQIRMTQLAIRTVINRDYNFLLSTVAPMNYASMADKFAADMVIFKIMKKYNGLDRYIFFKNLKRPILENEVDAHGQEVLDGRDINEHYAALAKPNMIGALMTKMHTGSAVTFATVSRDLLAI